MAEKLSTRKKKRLENKLSKVRGFLNLTAEEGSSIDRQIDVTQKNITEEPNERKTSHSDGGPSAKLMKLDSIKTNQMKTSLLDEYRLLSNISKQKSLTSLNQPVFCLKASGEKASLNCRSPSPLAVTDIQALILFLLGNRKITCKPRWCEILRHHRVSHVVVVVITKFSHQTYRDHREDFIQSDAQFHDKLEVVSPLVYGGSVMPDLLATSSVVQAFGNGLSPGLPLKAMFPISTSNIKQTENNLDVSQEKCSRTSLLLNVNQMLEDNYPLPLSGTDNKQRGYVMSRDSYSPVHDRSPLFSIDCEMCLCEGGQKELTRVSVVDEALKTRYNSLVRPRNRIIDYLTPYSGITEELLDGVTTRLDDVRKEISRILPPDAIIVGHSLNFDLHALKMFHPYVIDTSTIYNLTGGSGHKSKLSALSDHFLGEEIQLNPEGHCPVEDSRAAMKLVQIKLSHGRSFGDASMRISAATDWKGSSTIINSPDDEQNNLFAEVKRFKRKCAFIGSETLVSSVDPLLRPYTDALIATSTKTPYVSLVESRAREFDLTVANAVFTGDIKGLDEDLYRICQSMAPLGMLLVVFEGLQESEGDLNSGMLWVKLKVKNNKLIT